MSGSEPLRRRPRRSTATSSFGVGRRESHDAGDFYRRFAAPTVSDDDEVCHPSERRGSDRIFLGDIRDQHGTVAPRSVALVVTSPPYFSGKEYETAIGEGHVPGSYAEYLAMLAGVFDACVEVMEPGGRIAVNVANLGRKPYRSLSADVIRILEGDLGLLLRGEVIWQKARAAGGNCAWGTYQKPGDPVLRDVTERVVIASKGRFDRAVPPAVRAATGYPSEATIFRDEFLEATLDVWELPSESATRVGHPAPFPVELPQRLIDLYTYAGDLVLDPFMGSGSTAVAAMRTGRHFVGFETDPGYVTASLERITTERRRLEEEGASPGHAGRPRLPARPEPVDPSEDFWARGVREGRRARELAAWALAESGFTVVGENKRLAGGVEVSFVAVDQSGREWLFDVSGAFTSSRAGLRRTDALWKAVGKATVVQHTGVGTRYVLMTTDVPGANSAGAKALAAVTGGEPGKPVYDVIDLSRPEELARLATYGRGEPGAGPTDAT
ncbi:MAG: DNA-methyltransferase [Acidimicrobiales bacterium]